MVTDEEKNINGRIESLIKALKLSKNAFAASIGKSATVIKYILEKRNYPGYTIIVQILTAYPFISPDWLLLGKGSMYRTYKNHRGVSPVLENVELITVTEKDMLEHPQGDYFIKIKVRHESLNLLAETTA